MEERKVRLVRGSNFFECEKSKIKITKLKKEDLTKLYKNILKMVGFGTPCMYPHANTHAQ